jgi:hypothetical protein
MGGSAGGSLSLLGKAQKTSRLLCPPYPPRETNRNQVAIIRTSSNYLVHERHRQDYLSCATNHVASTTFVDHDALAS